MKVVKGQYNNIKDWVMDPRGYFLIRINQRLKRLEVVHCSKMPKKFRKHNIDLKIHGKTPQEVYFTATRLGLLTRFDHAAYLGKELEKAYVAMQLGLNYVQDDELVKSNLNSGIRIKKVRTRKKMVGKSAKKNSKHS